MSKDIFKKITPKNITAYQKRLADELNLSPATVKRRLSSIRKFCEWAQKQGYLETNPFLKETEIPGEFISQTLTARNNVFQKAYRAYTQASITKYFHYAVLIVFCAAIGFGAYDQFFKKAPEPLAYPAALTPPNRFLSFQGRLTDSSDNPISSATNLVFKLYDAVSAGNTLWNSGTCSITPDQDGIFSTLLGSSCGTEIAATVFSENANVWVGITIGADSEATPRMQIATVGYALNAETLQGYPPGTDTSMIPYINSSGDIVIAAASPTIQSTSGTFAIEGQTGVTIQAGTGVGGSITIAPKGEGVTNLTSEATTGNLLNNQSGANFGTVGGKEANNLYYGYAGTDSTNLNLLKLEAGATPATKFTVDASGNASASGILKAMTTGSYFTGDITVSGGDITGANSVILDIGEDSADYITSSVGLAVGGAQTYYINTGTSNLNALVLAGDLTIDTNDFFVDVSENKIGIGTTTLTERLTLAGNATISGTLALAPNVQFYAGTCDAAAAGKMYYDGDNNKYYYCNGTSWNGISEISGSGTTNYLPKWSNSSTLTDSVLYETGGNIGIGTTDPEVYKLYVAGNVSFNSGGIYSDDDNSFYVSRLVDSANSSYFVDPASVGTSATFFGNVGIGITSPIAKVEVSGTNTGKALAILNETGINDILTASASGIPKMIVSNTGNLDISGIFISSGGPKYFPIIYEGQAQDEDTFFNGFAFDQAVTITKITLSAKTPPTGANLTVDLLKDGSEQSQTATLTAGSNYEETDITNTQYTASNTFGLKVKSIGSTEAGRDLTVVIHYQDAAGGSGVNYISIPYEATAVDEDTILDGFYFDSSVNLTKVSLGTRDAPTGANLTVDLLKDGSEQSRIATLTAGSTFETTNITDTDFNTNDHFGLKIKSIGSSSAGESLQVIIHYTHNYGDTGTQYLPLLYFGIAQDEDDVFDGLTFDTKITIKSATLFARTAPSGAAFTIDLLKDGSERSRTMTLRSGSTYQQTNIKDDTYASSNRFGLRIKSIGSSSTEGESIVTILHVGQGSISSLASSPTVDGHLIIGGGDYNNLSNFSLNDGSLYVSGNLGVSGVAYLEGGTAWTSADIAEKYPTFDKSLEGGDLVSTEATASGYIQKSDKPYDTHLLGAISTNPAGVLGYLTPDSAPVALVGRVPIKVSNLNGPIKIGDPITSSELPGVGMKATEVGPIVGKALEEFDPENSKGEIITCPNVILDDNPKCGKIMVFLNVSWYDPDVFLTNTGDLHITQATYSGLLTDNNPETQNTKYEIRDAFGAIIQKIGAFADLIAANIQAGRIETQELISPVAEIEEIKTQRINLAEITSSSENGDIIINLENQNSTESSESSESAFGKLIIKGKEGKEVASIDSSGNASFSGQLTSDTLNVIRDATISGTLYADEIITKHGKFGDLLVNNIAKTETPIESMDETLANEATGSAILSEEEINNLINEILASVPEATSQAELSENIGIPNDLLVSNSLNIGGTLSLADNAVNTLSGPLYLQSLGLGGIDILAGKIVIDEHGNVTFEGNLTVKGRLAANTISPLPENDLVIDLAQIPITNEATQSAFGNLLIKGFSGQTVASIDASGSAYFASLDLEADYSATQSGMIIAAADNYQENGEYSPAIKTNATTGLGILPANESEIMIYNPKITEQSLIYITPLTDTKNKVVFVKSKKATEKGLPDEALAKSGWFKVAIDTPIDKEIRFNWWIVN